MCEVSPIRITFRKFKLRLNELCNSVRRTRGGLPLALLRRFLLWWLDLRFFLHDVAFAEVAAAPHLGRIVEVEAAVAGLWKAGVAQSERVQGCAKAGAEVSDVFVYDFMTFVPLMPWVAPCL